MDENVCISRLHRPTKSSPLLHFKEYVDLEGVYTSKKKEYVKNKYPSGTG